MKFYDQTFIHTRCLNIAFRNIILYKILAKILSTHHYLKFYFFNLIINFFFHDCIFSGQIKKIIKPNLFTKDKIKRQIIKVEKTPQIADSFKVHT